MQKIKMLVCLLVVVTFMSSCAMLTKTPLNGGLFTDVKSPVAVTGNSGSSKVGVSSAVSILGLVALGDASTDAAAKKAGITKIHHVDQHGTSIIGLFASYKIYVYGE